MKNVEVVVLLKAILFKAISDIKCNDCGCNFKLSDNRGKISPESKTLGLLMYGSGKASYGMIARLFHVSRSAVLYWIRSMGSKFPEPVIDAEIESVSIDEMWHFVEQKTKNLGLACRRPQ